MTVEVLGLPVICQPFCSYLFFPSNLIALSICLAQLVDVDHEVHNDAKDVHRVLCYIVITDCRYMLCA